MFVGVLALDIMTISRSITGRIRNFLQKSGSNFCYCWINCEVKTACKVNYQLEDDESKIIEQSEDDLKTRGQIWINLERYLKHSFQTLLTVHYLSG